MQSRPTSIDQRLPSPRTAARVSALRLDLTDPFDLHAPHRPSGSPRARRVGTALFWAAVTSLIVARVVMFDPAATRPVGEFPALLAAAH